MVRRGFRGDALLPRLRQGRRPRRLAHRDWRRHHGADDAVEGRGAEESVSQALSRSLRRAFPFDRILRRRRPRHLHPSREQNLKLWDVTGRPVTPPNEKFAVWTHPRETPGQLEFAIIERNTIDPRLQPAWSNEFWREHHPLGIEHASHITTVVRDLGAATKFYCDILGGKLIHENESAGRKRSAYVAIGEDTVVELAQPISSDTAEARDLEKNGEGVHSLTFKTRNVARAMDFLKSKMLKPEPDGAGKIVLGAEQAFGMVIGFTERPIPGDPRDN
jgi:methylmalonyl-CoA/ethylmalonyl-CoA epimerase